MKMRILIILFLISLAFNLGVFVKFIFKPIPEEHVHGEHVHEVGCVHEDWKGSPVCRHLNLTCQQLNQMEKYRIQFQNRISPLTMKIEKERLELFHLLKKDTLDENGANKILRQISNSQTEIQKCFIHHFFQTKKLFNNDQQKKFYFYVQQCLHKGNDGSCSQKCSPGKIEIKGKENGK
jgi:Spy/CpxP family protein refolding chaperone